MRVAGLLIMAALALQGCVWLPLQPALTHGGPIHVSAVHEVQPGETLEDIANAFSCTPAAIAAANNLPNLDTPPVGTELYIPRTSFLPTALKDVVYKPSYRFLERTHILRANHARLSGQVGE